MTLSKERQLTARIEPFDSFWDAPSEVEKGYPTLGLFYKHNYLKYLPQSKDASILSVSCGQGYFLHMMRAEGYRNVIGIDSDPGKVRYAQGKGLNAREASVFPFLEDNAEPFDAIFCETEINHLTKEEVPAFFALCLRNLREGGVLTCHSMNGANPITGAEALALNFDHYNTFTEYSMRQVLEYSGFRDVRVVPLKLYVFYRNPLNYVGMAVDAMLTIMFRMLFTFYGKSNRLFSKKIAGIGRKLSH